MAETALDAIHQIISELKEDRAIPRNVIARLEHMEEIFQNDEEDLYIKVDKALQIIDEIIEDTNLQPFIRTKLLNICSLLESI
ncbi:hypothetical protein DRJ48_02330 [Candidatus Woesearchaeota archaeon]|nr:UPF0147 family protein [Candidatus Woesearchaeota archaeon]RLE42923.1 MAG: hypothetical protein DRJ48_02330 [Candidatus Woesearchaeota archaeon]